ncbi:hypothetical protein [Saccharopolyspora sp. 5N708]|uniref:hypothetical protein n=1 Tax=Saccharopolyspora sp. 5N708 TaxID=3457424 RepID=UPI003FD28AD1
MAAPLRRLGEHDDVGDLAQPRLGMVGGHDEVTPRRNLLRQHHLRRIALQHHISSTVDPADGVRGGGPPSPVRRMP